MHLVIIFCFLAFAQIEAVLNENDEYYNGWEADRYDWTNHPCHRTCGPLEPSKTCYCVFVVELYSTMSKACYTCPQNLTDCSCPHCIAADGVQKTIYTVNRQLPGPIIEVCKDDKIVVDVRNTMMAESTTITWLGLEQLGTPYMDGVPYVTQCPILPGQSFRYEFFASTYGTYAWHSHIGSQRIDGLYGALLIHPKSDLNYYNNLYDFDDQLMIASDWVHLLGTSNDVKELHYSNGIYSDTILVNGKGRYIDYQKNNSSIKTPYAVFRVSQRKRHRFRMIHIGANCPIEVSIDKHTMTIISLDSNDIDPVEVDVITTWPGDRVDFVLNTNQKPGNYWIRYRGFGMCDPKYKLGGGFQVAILNYDSTPIQEPQSRIGYDIPRITAETRVFNPVEEETRVLIQSNIIDVPSLNSMTANDKALTKQADQTFYINFDFYAKDNYEWQRKGLYGFDQVSKDKTLRTMQLNHISLKLPSSPLLSQPDLINSNSLCSASYIPSYCESEYCACTRVEQIKLGSVVELVLIDEGKFPIVNHPLHMHGHFFRVVSQGYLGVNTSTIEHFKQLDREGKIIRKLHRAPIKNTIKTPNGGYTVLRFHAKNPGYWLFHCQLEIHSTGGMGLIFKVGEHWQFPKKPENFPTCGNFLPPPTLRRPYSFL